MPDAIAPSPELSSRPAGPELPRRRVLRGLAGAALALVACTVSEDSERLETFRDGGCGAGLEPGTGTMSCEYKGKPSLQTAPTTVTVYRTMCDGADGVVCEFSEPCGWTAIPSGTCRKKPCPVEEDSPVRHSIRVELPEGDTQCDPPDKQRMEQTCAALAAAQQDEMRNMCRNQRRYTDLGQISCCVVKPKKPGPSCDDDEACEDTGIDTEASSSESSDDLGEGPGGGDGGTDCPPGSLLECSGDPASEDVACVCTIAD